MKLVVITGCAGMIGSHVTIACLDQGYKVFGIDKMTYASNPNFISEAVNHPNFTFVQEDIVDVSYLPDCDYVINIAAESHVGNSIVDSESFIQSNIVGVKNLLDLIRNKQGNVADRPIFFHFSTDEVYGDIESGEHYETDTLKPSNPYSASKAAADMLVLAWARTYGINYLILRPTNNYGYSQYPEKLIPITIKNLMRNKKIKLHNKGEPVRSWLNCRDTAAAVITLIKAGVQNEIFNVSGGFEQKNIDTVSKIIECYLEDADLYGNMEEKGEPPEEKDWSEYLDLSYVREGQDVRYSLNDDKLRSLGWEPKVEFDKEIKSIVRHYKNNFRW